MSFNSYNAITPIKAGKVYQMYMNYRGIEIYAQAMTEDKCREIFEKELAYHQMLMDDMIVIGEAA